MKGPGHYLWAARHEYRLWRERRAQRARMLAFYGGFVKRGDLVFDVGANAGNRTDVFLELGARVVAVEPQSGMASQLRRRFGRRAGFTLENVALGDAPGETDILQASASGIATMSPEWMRAVKESGRFAEHAWDKRERVKVTTFDALIERHGAPRFTKIDVEGFEAHVLRGLTRPLPGVSFEFTPEHFVVAEACVRRLDALGPTRFNYSDGEGMTLAWPDWVDADEALRRLMALDPRTFGDVYARAAG